MNQNFSFIDELNKEQKEAATTLNGPVLIIAGAGSGKTKTIVARTALLIASKTAKPENILVMTFTNKAAKEMSERGKAILENNGLWNGVSPTFTTFHSWGAKFLRNTDSKILENIGIKNNFTIIDSSYQEKILGKIVPQIFDLGKDSLKKALKAKNLLLPLGNLQNNLIPYESEDEAFKALEILQRKDKKYFSFYPENVTVDVLLKIAKMLVAYKNVLRENNSVDFDDLIVLPIKIIQENQDIQKFLKNKYQYIMIDEFQDTNKSQLTLTKLMIGDNENICVVGDDAQSIYGWRGAKVKYILGFHNNFKNVKKINLKTNYRSNISIVERANALLEFATEKHEFKENLVAFRKNQGRVEGMFFKSAEDEADYISNKIDKLINLNGVAPKDITILYRNNMISRQVSSALFVKGIPCKVVGGRALLDRAVVKNFIDVLMYLDNPSNELSVPNILATTGMTSTMINRLIEESSSIDLSITQYVKSDNFQKTKISKTAIQKTLNALNNIEYLNKQYKVVEYQQFLDILFQDLFFVKELADKIKEGELANSDILGYKSSLRALETLKSIMEKYANLREFMERLALEDQDEEDISNKVNLMTVHASKGLEFDYVFVIGMTQGIFPSKRSLASVGVEEERRLAYVAFTRAKNELYVSGASFYYGDPSDTMSYSQFTSEAGIRMPKI